MVSQRFHSHEMEPGRKCVRSGQYPFVSRRFQLGGHEQGEKTAAFLILPNRSEYHWFVFFYNFIDFIFTRHIYCSHTFVQSPSQFAQNRQNALRYTLERFEKDDFDKVPVFFFGDFNFRLDTASVIQVGFRMIFQVYFK